MCVCGGVFSDGFFGREGVRMELLRKELAFEGRKKASLTAPVGGVGQARR